MTLVRPPCGLCGGTAFDLIFPTTIRDPENDPASYFSSSRRRAGYLDIVRCRTCSLVMSNPRDDEATLTRVYSELADTEYAAEHQNRAATAERHLDVIARYRARPGRLLDVGCATGVFAGRAHARGWQVWALDASTWAIERAKAAYPGPTFLAGRIEDVALPSAAVDVITMWDVLEHVASPPDTLRRLAGLLDVGGLLVLNVPNVESVMARLMGRRWVLLLREHLWYFSPATIARLLGETGFETLATHTNLVRFSLANIAQRLAQHSDALGRSARSLVSPPWLARRAVTFPIGEMTVVARRTQSTRA